ncbi:hypothetical protein J4448_04455 [Candidatus Woesearchaeota archaeon]|nr:hypothetical protein [Candidatus Woesearchaeota archaeon]
MKKFIIITSTINNFRATNFIEKGQLNHYIACGCCGGAEPREMKCLYRSKGDNLLEVVRDDWKKEAIIIADLLGVAWELIIHIVTNV